MAVAQPVTVCAAGVLVARVWSAPLVKHGASLTAVDGDGEGLRGDVSTPPLAVPPLS